MICQAARDRASAIDMVHHPGPTDPLEPDDLRTGLIVLDAAGQVVRMNAAAVEILFTPETEGLATHRGAVPLPDRLVRWTDQIREHLRPVLIAETTLEDDREDSPLVDVFLRPAGDGFVVELTPVTERIRQRELADRADRQQALTRMVRSLAHELRNPLGGVRGAAQLITRQTEQPDILRHAALIEREVQRITQLIEHFAEGAESEFAPVNIHRILEEALELILAESRQGALIARDFDPSIPEFPGIADQLHRLVLNLMRNALQARATRLRLVTRIERTAPFLDTPGSHALRVDFEDNGEGVPQELRQRLFLPMVTGRETGSGFGLAVVQQIARRHGGLVEYAPLPDGGSRFRLRLPLGGQASARPPNPGRPS